MIITKKKEERVLKEACNISLKILKQLGEELREGVTGLEIDREAGFLCKKYKVKPAFKRVDGYNFNTCISVNDVAVHGVPKDIPFKKGDLVSVDFGIYYKKIYTDHCWTWSIGEPSKTNKKLLNAGRAAVENAVSKAVTGNRTGDLGYEMEAQAKKNGYNTIKVFVGHGIGKTLHDEPEILAYGKKGTGELLEEGMVLCIECQVVDDVSGVQIDEDDGWSARTLNGGNSVMFEYMVIVRDKKPEILTDTRDWGVVV
jgi:methionyl aminopeptidase